MKIYSKICLSVTPLKAIWLGSYKQEGNCGCKETVVVTTLFVVSLTN